MKPDKCATAFLQAGYHFWQRITQPVDVLDDLASQRRAQLLASFLVFLLLLGMAVGILPSILHYGVDYIGRVDFLVMVGTMLSIVAVYILSRTRYFVVAALLTVSVMSLGVILMALPDDINLLVYLVVPVLLSSILLSIEATMMLVLVQLVAMMLLPALFAPDVSLVDDNWVGFVMTVSGLILIIAHYRNLLEQDRRGELIGSEMRYRALFDQAYDPTFMETADQEIIDANTAACDLFGYSRDELLTMRTLDLKPPYTRAEPKRRVYSETTGVERFETVVVKRDGDLIPVEITVAPMKFGDETFFLSTVRDITERKQAEQALRHERDLLSRITDTSPIGITIVDAEGQITFANPFAEDILGVTKDEITQRTYNAPAWHVTDFEGGAFPDEQMPFSQVKATGQPIYNVRHAIEWSDGSRALLSIHGAPLFDENGQFEGGVFAIEDVSQQVVAAQALKENEELMRQVLDTSPECIYVKDSDGRYILVNNSIVELYGTMPEEMIGKTDREFASVLRLTEQEALKMEEDDRRARDSDQPIVVPEESFTLPDGSARWFQTVKVSLALGSKPDCVLGVSVDITGRKQAEEALAKERNLLRTLLDSIPDHIYVKDSQSRFVLVNTTMVQRMGINEPEDMIGKSDADYYPPELAHRYQADEQEILRTGQPLIAYEEPCQDLCSGQPLWLLTTKVPLRGPDGSVIGLVGIGHDITDRKHAQQALDRRTRALQSVHELALDVGANLNLSTLLRHILQRTADLLDAEMGGCVYLYQPDQDRLVMVEGIGADEDYIGDVLKPGEGLAGRVFQTRLPLAVEDYRTWGGRVPIGNDWPFTAMLHVPLLWQGNTIGVLGVNADKNRRIFSPDDVWLAEKFAAQAAIAIHNAQLFAAEQEQRALSDALRDTAAAVSSTLDLDEVLDHILANLERVVEHDAADIMLIEGEYARIVRCRGYAERGSEETLVARLYDLDSMEWMRDVIRERQVHVVADTSRYPGWVAYPETSWIRSSARAPITREGRVIGFLNVNSMRTDAFSAQDAERLQSFAEQAAVAIHNAQLFAAEQDQRALSDALRDTAAAVSSTLDLDEVLDRILANIGRVTVHDAADIMLIDGDYARIVRCRGYAQRGVEQAVLELSFKIDETYSMCDVLKTGQAQVISDTAEYARWVKMPTSEWIRSHAVAPIKLEEQVIGFLNVDSATPNAFAPEDAERLQAFADQAAIAVRNARLYAETRRHAKDLEQRVMARTIDLGVRNAVAETLSSSLDVAEMLDGVLQTTVEQLGVLGGAIYLLSEDARSMDLLAHTGISEEALSLVTGITPGSTDLSLGHDIAVALSEDALDVRQETGISAVLSVPIMRQEQIQGVITLVHNQPRPWRNEESRMLDAIGRQIGVALANAGLYADAVRREAHIRTILQGVTDGLLVFDQNANLTLINPAAENLFAFYSPSLGGTQHAASLLWTWLQEHEPEPGAVSNVELALPSAPLPSGLESVRAQCVAQECLLAKQEDLSWPCWLAEGISQDEMRRCAIFERVPRRAVQVQSAEVRDAEGQFLGTVVALHDVTYYRELDTLKGQFVSNVSHELRTPLAAVLLQLSTLLKYYDRFGEAERRDILNEIEEQAQLLRELIEGILELSRFDARRKTLQRRWFDLSGECRNVVSALRPVMSEKRLHLDMSRCAAIQYALGDQQQLTQVFRNLLSNAIKYTPEDGRIRVRLEQVGSEVQLAVEDTGVGISQEEQVYVFDRFFRSENVSQMAPGTGLGLSITKEIIDLHEGWIDLHSVLGEGSTFTVHLPLPEDTDKQVRDTRLDVERQGG